MTPIQDIHLGFVKTVWYAFRSGAVKKLFRGEIDKDGLEPAIAEYVARKRK